MRSQCARSRGMSPGKPEIAEGPVSIDLPDKVDPVAANGLPLSAAAIATIMGAIGEGAAANSHDSALAIGYRAFAETACHPAAKEGMAAFAGRRAPDFKTTG